MPSSNANQVFLGDAVTTIKQMVTKKEHGERGHVGHYLFALRAAGHKFDYDTLMCLTGTAFSFYYCHDNYHVAYSMPDGWESRVARAAGGKWEWMPQRNVEEAWEHVKVTIDSGNVVWGEYMEGVTFAGYEDAEKKEDRRVFALDPVFVWPGKWWTWAEFEEWWNKWAKPFPPAMGRYSEGAEAASLKQMGLEVLKLIPKWSQDDHPKDLPEARFGLAGIEAYASDIADASKGDDFIIGPWRGCHAINPQWTARKCPGVYLRSIAGEFKGKTKSSILKAAEAYDASYASWKKWNDQLGGNAPKDAWQSKERRTAGAAAIREALSHEKAAIQETEGALTGIADRDRESPRGDPLPYH